ncbi:MAG: hypothetical protein IKD80_05265 [Selenomonadaceae bacterium]|nr:hypothetical protein [Selenomonadaceae bacterium]
MAGVVEELNELVRRETTERVTLKKAFEFAEKLIVLGKMTLEEISVACELPLEKVRELAANISAQPKESN